MKVLALTTILWFAGFATTELQQGKPMPYPPCDGGEVGFWQPVKEQPNGVWMVLTKGNAPPFEPVCYVPAAARVMVMGKELPL